MSTIAVTSVFSKNITAFNQGKRFIINQGGTSSSKTYSIMQLIYLISKYKEINLISVVSETMPHIKKGVMRDFFNILGDSYSDKMHNKTDNIYTINGTDVEFFGADNPGRVRGPRRDILFCNEANNIKKEIFDQLEVRTNKAIFIDFNPVAEFYIHDLINLQNAAYIHSTYRDNQYLNEEIIKSIERRKDLDPNWWRVYGLGEVGNIETLVFWNWDQVDVLPQKGISVWGLDFGFSNDPTALIHCVIDKENIYLDEVIYSTGLLNTDISRKMQESGMIKRKDTIIADSAEPKTIEMLYVEGWNIKKCDKGKDSIEFGIDIMKQHKIHITKTSINLIKEFRNYAYEKDKYENILNKIVDKYNHGIDASRYAITSVVKPNRGRILSFSSTGNANW